MAGEGSARKPVAKKAESAIQAGKWVYSFGGGKAEGKAGLKNLLGGKGANLAEMANLGLPVPPGFTIPTSVCTYFYENGKTYPKELEGQVEKALAQVGKITNKSFGDAKNPLLVSVRSGARASMPGMMDTVLNLGLNDTTVEALASLSGDRRFAYDSYRRFITMYSDVVLGFDHHHFEEILDTYKDFGFEDVTVKFSDRPAVRAGTDETWDRAEAALKGAVEAAGFDRFVLVGHSYGGMVITMVATRLGGQIDALVYLDAFLPGDGESEVMPRSVGRQMPAPPPDPEN